MNQATHEKTGREAVLRRLKEFAKAGAALEGVEAFADAITKETDRGAVVMLGSLLEDALEARLAARMTSGLNNPERSALFGFNGLLGTFSAKIRMARALGLVDKGHAELLDIIREIRNACAHSRQDISFQTPELRDALALLLDDEAAELVRTMTNPEGGKFAVLMVWAYLSAVVTGQTPGNAQVWLDDLVRRAFIAATLDAEGSPEPSPDKPA